MNLAALDIRHNAGRFALTAVGIGLLLMTVMGMSGIYRGMIEDALLVVDRIGADLWVVQRGTRGPFAEISRVPANLEYRLLAVPGVVSARAFVSHNVQRERQGKPLRMNVMGLSWPSDRGPETNRAVSRRQPFPSGRRSCAAAAIRGDVPRLRGRVRHAVLAVILAGTGAAPSHRCSLR